jgi:purine-binding chemotaxis protein CheW
MPGREDDRNRRLLILALAGRTLGIVVDEVTEVITVPVANLKPPPQVTHGVGAEYLVGVCLVEDDLVMLLDPDRLLTGSEADELGGLGEMKEVNGWVELT